MVDMPTLNNLLQLSAGKQEPYQVFLGSDAPLTNVPMDVVVWIKMVTGNLSANHNFPHDQDGLVPTISMRWQP
jgi:hypothetical protein